MRTGKNKPEKTQTKQKKETCSTAHLKDGGGGGGLNNNERICLFSLSQNSVYDKNPKNPRVAEDPLGNGDVHTHHPSQRRTGLTDRHRWDSGDDVGGRDFRGEGGGWSIDHDLPQVVQQFLGAVLGGGELEQLGVFVDEVCVHHARQELLILQHVQQEGAVGLKLETNRVLLSYQADQMVGWHQEQFLGDALAGCRMPLFLLVLCSWPTSWDTKV